MKLNIIKGKSHYHFIGIGGINMSGLAKILHNDGCIITGSDQNDSDIIKDLKSSGINVAIGHDAKNISPLCQVVVYNAAVPNDNPEMVRAKAQQLHIIDRATLLGLLMQNYDTAICIAGTHGKTTTTSMLAEIFIKAGLNPTVMNGGHLASMGGAMRLGGRSYIIVESCEYHNSFLKFWPKIGIILNIEMDHGDYFKDINDLTNSFKEFAQKIPRDGFLAINKDIPGFSGFVSGLDCKVCAFNDNGGYLDDNEDSLDDNGDSLDDNVNSPGNIKLKIPGEHNVQNAMAAASVAMHCGISIDDIICALEGFTGPMRRFELVGNYNGADIIDDYAHHPTEVKATLTAAKDISKGRVWAVFQPHTHSRTLEFLKEFAQALKLADQIIILDIYTPAGREERGYKIKASHIADEINSPNCRYISSFEECINYLKSHIAPNDMVINMGAGDVGDKVARQIAHSRE